MKYLLGAVFSALVLTSCQHQADPAPVPAPTLLGDKWILQTEEQEITPLDGSPADVRVLHPQPGAVTMSYLDEQHFTLDMQLPSGASRYHLASTYAYQGEEVNFTRLYSRAAKAVVPRIMRVSELSLHRLVLVEAWQSTDTHYFTILTFSR
jgi:hypothetical protein